MNYALAIKPRATDSVGHYRDGVSLAVDQRAHRDYEPEVVRFQAAFAAKFKRLADDWRTSVMASSSIHEIVSDPSYLKIIALGEKVLPYLVDELERAPDHWFVALEVLTGVNPVRPADRGNMQEMRRAWLEWADREGYA